MLPQALRPAWRFIQHDHHNARLAVAGALFIVAVAIGLSSITGTDTVRSNIANSADGTTQGGVNKTLADTHLACSELVRDPKQPLTVQLPCSQDALPLSGAQQSNVPLQRSARLVRATALTAADLAIIPPGTLRQTILEPSPPVAQMDFQTDSSLFALSPPQR